MNKLKIAVVALVALVGGYVGVNLVQNGTTFAESSDCGNNAIVLCGVMTPSELKAKYATNDFNMQGIFSHYGITASDIANSASAKTGYVTPDQNIVVDGKVIATHAISVGRTTLSGPTAVHIGNVTVYQGPRTFKTTQAVYVFYNADGSFRSAVMKVCGNPVPATPVPVVKPVYACNTLQAVKLSRNEYQFTTNATAQNGATIKGYTYNFGDTKTQAAGNRVTHTYENAGTYTATVSVEIAVGSTVYHVTNNCKVTVTVAPEIVTACNIETGVIGPVDKTKVDNVHYTYDNSKCNKETFCDTATMTFVTVIPSQKKSTYTTDYSKCNVSVCDLTNKTIVSIDSQTLKNDTTGRYTTDQSKCNTPVTVTETSAPTPPAPAVELPHTGPVEMLGSGLGAGALSLAGYYYFMSRRLG